ncbi:MAG: PKD domain-containing protein [Planctomycetales bacterium]|nr:PKD domain-containing protein [bacterium]UNM08610.1 MAG: PKD domain-containing protein [Planctomycetales bacterium]
MDSPGEQNLQPEAGLSSWPASLPEDRLQPWEQLDADGLVVPAERSASGINLESEFIPGVERFSSTGDVGDNGEASRIASAAGTTAQAMYRIPLAGGHPGVVSVDANLLAGKGYYIGLADYGSNRWQWHGPFTDNHVRLSTALQGPYTSSLGSLFVSVLVHGGSAADVVGIGVNTEDPADTTAPDQPTGLAATSLDGVLLLNWQPVIAGDLAGYRIYYSTRDFISGSSAGVSHVDSLEGLTQHQLAATGQAYIRISAIDISGNESALSDIISALPLAGDAPALVLSIDKPSGSLAEGISLSASGAESYDFDVDGDGTYDITADTSGSAQVDTSRLGIIRPRVRATGTEGTAVALGSVSLVISGNSRPVAVALADLASGSAPLEVSFDGSGSMDFDGSIVGGGWDFDGDGTYDVWDDTDIVHVTSAGNTYTTPGTYNAKLRVVDDQGAWDVDTVSITVSPVSDPENLAPTADIAADVNSGNAPLAVSFDASGSSDSDGSIIEYAWDWDGDGGYDTFSDTAIISHTFTEAGSPLVRVRVEDNDGARATASIEITVNVVGNLPPVAALAAGPDPGFAGFKVTLDASGSSDPDGSIVSYEWDFNSDGIHDSFSEAATATHTYDSTGEFHPVVRVTDNTGAQDTVPATVTIVESLSQAVDSDGDVGIFSSMAVVDGYPAISYHDYGSLDLKYVRATNIQGTAWSTPIPVDTAGNVGTWTSLTVVDGNPAISYYHVNDSDLRYVRASDPQGSAWGTPVALDTAINSGFTNSLAVVDGQPAISYYDGTNGDLRYIRALDPQGSSWDSPLTLDSTGFVGKFSSLGIVDGFPAVSYEQENLGDLKYVRALDAQGAAWDTPISVDTAGSVGTFTTLAIVDGYPAISYLNFVNGDLLFVRASNAQGSTWGSPPVIAKIGGVSDGAAMAVVDGFPAISYFNTITDDLEYIRASDAQGTAWISPLSIDTAGLVGLNSSLVVVDGYAAISYGDSSNADLKYVILP